jgi:hypothetical protein
MALIDPVMLKTRLGALAGRFGVDALDECDSTNSELMRRAERARHPARSSLPTGSVPDGGAGGAGCRRRKPA